MRLSAVLSRPVSPKWRHPGFVMKQKPLASNYHRATFGTSTAVHKETSVWEHTKLLQAKEFPCCTKPVTVS